MSQYHFGAGNLYGISTASGTQTPRKFGALQDVALDVSFAEKLLYGSNQYAIDVARGQAKVAGKAKYANMNGAHLNDLFFGQGRSVGNLGYASAETGSIPGTPFQITVVNGATFSQDLGVLNTSTGLLMTKVASAPTTGQYSVSGAGVYTFAAADTGQSVAIDYGYSIAAVGSTVQVINVLAGSTPYFQVHFPMKRVINGTAQVEWWIFNKCTSTKLSFATKNDDFKIMEFDFVAVADANGVICAIEGAE